uniref:Uncharacterized protein n=1 Tax=Rhizophora mucronata TaxID=61149 RepID=A0A2P2IXS2_RHIMU
MWKHQLLELSFDFQQYKMQGHFPLALLLPLFEWE